MGATKRDYFFNFIYNCAKKNKKGINVIQGVSSSYSEHYKTVQELEVDAGRWGRAPGLEIVRATHGPTRP